MKNTIRWLALLLTALMALLPLSAAAEALPVDDAPDYADAENWAWWAEGAGEADLFMVCPTVDMGRDGNLNMDIGNEKMRGKFRAALNQERLLFEDCCTLYAPYYRQATFPAYEGDGDAAFELAYADVLAAFASYLSANPDRPLVLAGFSQGAQMLLRLMKECFSDEALQDRLVAAYLFGWRITDDDLAEAPWLKLAEGEADTGSIIAFEVEAPEVTDSLIVPAGVKTHAINPLNWRTDGERADKSLNLGAVFTDGEGAVTSEIPALTGCYIDAERGTLKAPDVSPEDYPGVIFPDGVYHLYDFFFFYRNLQQNVATRLSAFMGAGEAARE